MAGEERESLVWCLQAVPAPVFYQVAGESGALLQTGYHVLSHSAWPCVTGLPCSEMSCV